MAANNNSNNNAQLPNLEDLKLHELEAIFLIGNLDRLNSDLNDQSTKDWLEKIRKYRDLEHKWDYTRNDKDKEGTITSEAVQELMLGIQDADAVQKVVIAVQNRNGELYSKDVKANNRTQAENYQLSYKSGLKVLAALEETFSRTRTAEQHDTAEVKNELSKAFEQLYSFDLGWKTEQVWNPTTSSFDPKRELESSVMAKTRDHSKYDSHFRKAADCRLEIGALKNSTKQYGQRDPLKWSDAVFAAYRKLRENIARIPELAPADELGQIYQWMITNEQTRATIKEVYAKNPEHIKEPYAKASDYLKEKSDAVVVEWSLRTGNEKIDEAFIALLGTPNGVGAGWLLVDHNDDLGHKTIASIVTAYGKQSGFGMWIVYT